MTFRSKLFNARPSRYMLIKMVTFGLVGVGNTIVDLAVFTVAYKMLELPLIPANFTAWIVAVSCSYIMNTMITFRAESGRVLRSADYQRFLASGIVGVMATTTTIVILANYTSVLIAKLISVLVSFMVNFTLSHFLVFRSKLPT